MKRAIFTLLTIFILSINLYTNDEFVTSNEFISACEYGFIEIVEEYIKNKEIDINTEYCGCEFNHTGLMYAAINGHYEVVKLLLENGANPNIKALNGGTALILASAKKENTNIINILLDYGSDINAMIEDDKMTGITSLFYAIHNNFENNVKVLLERGADPNIEAIIYGQLETSPLIYAMDLDNIGIAYLLIEHGSDINSKNNKGYTALDYAIDKGYYELEKLLRSKNAYSKLDEDKKINLENHLPDGFTLESLSISGSFLEGVLINNKGNYSYLSIHFTIYDRDNNRIGTAMDNLNEYPKGERWKFSAYMIVDYDLRDQIKTIKVNGVKYIED